MRIILILFLLSSFTVFAQKTDSLVVKKDTVKNHNFAKVMSQVIGRNPLTPELTPRVVFIRSMLVPGWGQATNKQYAIMPIVYVSAAAGAYFGIRNNNLKFNNYRASLLKMLALSKGNVILPDESTLTSTEGYMSPNSPTYFFNKDDLRKFYAKDSDDNYYSLTINEASSTPSDTFFDATLETEINDGSVIGPFAESSFESSSTNYRRYRDLSIIGMALGWTLFAVQANVQAHLNSFDLSDDISMKINPILMPTGAFGAKLTINLK